MQQKHYLADEPYRGDLRRSGRRMRSGLGWRMDWSQIRDEKRLLARPGGAAGIDQIKLPLNLSTLSDTWSKFIGANRSRPRIVLLPLGTAGRHGNDESRNFEGNEKSGLRSSATRSIWSLRAPSFPRGLGMP